MNNTPTPMTDELYRDHMSDPYQDTGDLAAIMHIQCERFERELTAVTEQRDRLAEALREITTYDPSDGQCNSGYSCKYIAEQALQSLTTNKL